MAATCIRHALHSAKTRGAQHMGLYKAMGLSPILSSAGPRTGDYCSRVRPTGMNGDALKVRGLL